MSTKRARQRKRAGVRARAEGARLWREVEEFGIRVETVRQRVRMSWTVDPDPVVALVSWQRFRQVVDQYELELVAELRAEGLSWADIGGLIDITADGARKRYVRAEDRAQEMLAEEAAAG